MGSTTNIWGTTAAVSITAVLAAYVDASAVETSDVEAAIDSIMVPAVSGETFSAAEVLALGQAAAVEYTEKHFAGPEMSDDEWASL